MSSPPASPKTRILAVADRITAEVRRLDDARDSRAVFAYTYELMTRGIAAEVDRAGFQDPDWVATSVERFAEYFFVAHQNWDSEREVSEGWRVVLKRLRETRTSVLEEMILGMTVHIVFDLPHAIIDATNSGAELHRRMYDHHRLNSVIGGAIDSIQDKVSAKYWSLLRWLDIFAGNQDEIVTNFGIRVGRGMAWYNAQRLLDPEQSTDAEKSLAKSVSVIANDILDPPMLGWAIRLLRLLSSLFRRWPARSK